MTGPDGVAPTLEVDQVVKHFGGVRALDGVDLEIRAGEVHCLCGENGAGKSTLIKILGGVHPHGSYGGTIRIDGREARFRGARDAARAGIAVIYQELVLVEAMSVAENLFLGDWPRRGPLIDWPRMMRESAELLCQFGVDVDPESRAGSLGIGRKQQVEILKAVRKQSRVLILDEPTAALGETEVRSLLDLVRRLAHQGVACLYITHRLEEVRSIADRVTVLRDGRNVASFEGGAVSPRDLIRAMAGRPLPAASPRRSGLIRNRRSAASGSVFARCQPAIGETLRLGDITFELRAGEVVGVAGLMGSGRSELLMHLYGAWGTRRAGSVRLCGQIHDSPSPERSLKRGMALLTEDRRRFGLIPDQSVAFNLTLSSLPQLTRHGLVDAATEIADLSPDEGNPTRCRGLSRGADPAAVRGQSAEGAPGARAPDRASRYPAGRADARGRRRHQVRDLRADQPLDGGGQGGCPGFERAARTAGALRPAACPPGRTNCRGVAPRSAGSGAHCGPDAGAR